MRTERGVLTTALDPLQSSREANADIGVHNASEQPFAPYRGAKLLRTGSEYGRGRTLFDPWIAQARERSRPRIATQATGCGFALKRPACRRPQHVAKARRTGMPALQTVMRLEPQYSPEDTARIVLNRGI